MRRRTVAAAVVIVVVVLLGVALSGCTSASSPRAGSTVLSMRLDRLDTAGRTTIGDHAGRPLVVNLFASWCTPCAKEMPAFETVHRSLGDDVTFLGVAVRDTERAARALVRRTGVTYAVAIDRDDGLLTAVRAVGMPVTLFVRPDGTIAETHSGQLSESQLRDLLAEALLLPVSSSGSSGGPVRVEAIAYLRSFARSSFGVHRGQAGFDTATPPLKDATTRNGSDADELS
jgi:thiol-disulfide isomerase/thioredoxin